MGSVSSYSTSSGRRYRVRFRRPDGSQTDKRGFTNKRDAEVFLASIEVSKARGDFIELGASLVLLGTLGADWMRDRSRVVKPSTYRSLESAWRNHVAPKWSLRPIGSIRHSEVQTWVSLMATTQSPTNVLRSHGILAGIFDSAVKDRRLSANPARGVALPRKTRRAKAYLTHVQVELLAESSAEATMIRFLAYTGLRWGEATGLRVRNVDLTRGRALVTENAVAVSREIVIGTPKTHHNRSVPVPPFLLDALAEVVNDRQGAEFVFGRGDSPMRRPNSEHGWFASAVARARAVDPAFPRVTPHELRHTAASLAISAGANVKAVQRMLGHASAAMTLDTYSDLFDDDLDAVSAALDRARATSIVGIPWAGSESD